VAIEDELLVEQDSPFVVHVGVDRLPGDGGDDFHGGRCGGSVELVLEFLVLVDAELEILGVIGEGFRDVRRRRYAVFRPDAEQENPFIATVHGVPV
jgi:hypothetical protein